MKRETLRHPKTYDLASRLGCSRPEALGFLTLLWDYTADMAPRGDLGKWPNGTIARACEWSGDADKFVDALIAAGWLDECPENRLVIHDLADHALQWWKQKVTKLGLDFVRPAVRSTASTAVGTAERTDNGSVPSTVASIQLSSAQPCSAQPCSDSCAEPPEAGNSTLELTDYEFPCSGKDAEPWRLPRAKFDEYVGSFPHLDVDAQLRSALQWCRDNPTKRKTPGHMVKFLGNWLARAQDSGRAGNGKPAPRRKSAAESARAHR
jgi:hypothetical protein